MQDMKLGKAPFVKQLLEKMRTVGTGEATLSARRLVVMRDMDPWLPDHVIRRSWPGPLADTRFCLILISRLIYPIVPRSYDL